MKKSVKILLIVLAAVLVVAAVVGVVLFGPFGVPKKGGGNSTDETNIQSIESGNVEDENTTESESSSQSGNNGESDTESGIQGGNDNENNTESESKSESDTEGNGETETEAHVHAWIVKDEYKAASCTEDGYGIVFCNCGTEKKGIIEAKGHNFGQWTVEIAADCEHFGKESSDCADCGEKISRTVEKTVHNYTVELTQNQYGGEINSYTCVACGDNFEHYYYEEDQLDTISLRYFEGCPVDYNLIVYCEKDENYIRENLTIVEDYYAGTGKGEVEYEADRWYGSIWRITPVTDYEKGNTYRAMRSGVVLFYDENEETFFTGETTFSIERPESAVAEYRDDILYLKTLENTLGGYYPYTLEYSKASGLYWLSLGKSDGLKIGDVICVGDAVCAADVKNGGDGENQFGKIASINYIDEEGRYFIALESPELSEIFEKLDIYDPVVDLEEDDIEYANLEELSVQAKSALLGSDDFGNFVCAVKDTTDTYLMARGLSTPFKTIADFIKSIKIDEEASEMPRIEDNSIKTKIVLKGEMVIPVTLSSEEDSDKVGNVTITFTAYVDVQKLTVGVQIDDYVDENTGEVVKFRVGVDQTVEAGFTFSVEVKLDYSLGSTPYLLNTQSGVYHYKSCKNAALVKDKSKLKALSAEEIFAMMANDEIDTSKECGTCLPISSMMADGYVLNYNSRTIHLFNCAHLKTVVSAVLGFSEQPYGNLLKDGYSPCRDCNPESRYTNGFSEQLLRQMNYQDFADGIDEYKEALKEIGAGDGSEGRLAIAKIPVTLTGIDMIELSLEAYFEFKLEASFQYTFKKVVMAQYGIKLTENGFTNYYSFDEDTLENNIALTGKLRIDTGLIAGINLHVIGLDKFCYADLEAKIGIYGKVHGALYVDFLYGYDSYAAAYFEAGLHADLTIEAKVIFAGLDKTSMIPNGKNDIPLLRYGYDKIYYNFENMPDEIVVDGIFYDMDAAGIFKVKYLDLPTMTSGTESLSPTGIENKYKVNYYLYDGSHCSVSDGFILINDYDVSFTDTLVISIHGEDDWGKYREGNSVYLTTSVIIKIKYNAENGGAAAEIPENAYEYNGHYYMIYNAAGRTTMDDIRAFCEAKGGYLVTIGDGAENNFLSSILNDTNFTGVYLGISKVDGEWKWMNGEVVKYAPENYYDYGNEFAVMLRDRVDWTSIDFAGQNGLAFVCEWGAYSVDDGKTVEEKMAELVGRYQGWYTAGQGITGIDLDIYRTNVLVEDEVALQRLADYATNSVIDKNTGLPAHQFTVDEVRNIINNQISEYVAVFMYYPLRENPDVESGICVLTVEYDEETGYMKLMRSEWIQHDTYVMCDVLNVRLAGGDILVGDIYSETGGWFWNFYEDIGDLRVTKVA